VPQAELQQFLQGVGEGFVGMDCSVVPLKHQDLFMISTTDYFYPSVDDPYVQGKIGAANVLSDLYAMGVVDCDNVLMILAASTDMTKQDRAIVTPLMIKGFNDQVKAASSIVTGGQTVMNPWPIIGGTAVSVCKREDFILPEGAVDGDVLVLTKPLGTQVAVNVHQWMFNERWDSVKHILTKEDAERAYQTAMDSMARLNRTAAKLMHKYGAHAATDVTGFGLLGHSTNLVKNQKAAVNFEIHTLPIIRFMKEVDDEVKRYNLLKGMSAETSGGILACLPADKAALFCKEIEEIDGYPAWIIGKVTKSSADRSQNTSTILTNPTFIFV